MRGYGRASMINNIMIIETLKLPKQDEARTILERVSQHVQPIMRARKWTVGTLAELSPTQTKILGLNENRGRTIRVRLRQPYNNTDFLVFDDIMGTMLHELVHNVFGPHDAKFYNLLDELNIEYDKLLSDGSLNAQRGQTLGGSKARSKVKGTEHRLGGGNMHGSIADRALQAAKRRAFDSQWCGQGYKDNPVVIDDEAVDTVIEIPVIEIEDDPIHPALPRTDLYNHIKTFKPISVGWTCDRCTYHNGPTADCAMCDYHQSGIIGDHWICSSCRHVTENRYWCCGECQRVKDVS